MPYGNKISSFGFFNKNNYDEHIKFQNNTANFNFEFNLDDRYKLINKQLSEQEKSQIKEMLINHALDTGNKEMFNRLME